MEMEALEWESPEAESAKTSSMEVESSTSMRSSSSTSGTPALKMSMASERATDGEKKPAGTRQVAQRRG